MKQPSHRSCISLPIIVALFVGLAASRYWPGSQEQRVGPVGPAVMPAQLDDATAQNLYLSPGGKYTERDIAANGGVTAAERYRGFRAVHDLNPRPGDAMCPITQTKADPRCTWIVNGNTYQFCCPPCIDEFVQLAKDQPEKIKEADAYFRVGRL